MAKVTIKGFEDFSSMLLQLGSKRIPIAKFSCYDGAAVLAAALKDEIKKLPEQSGYMPEGEFRNVVKPTEKEALLEGVGISHITEKDGIVSVRVGFDGYSKLRTKKYPMGLPVAIIARGVVTGGKVRVYGHDFVYRAGRTAEQAVKRAMEASMVESINRYTK